jgi:hypothetical protein
MKHIQLYENFEPLNEMTIDRFRPDVIEPSDAIDPQFFKNMMPKTASTSTEAQDRILTFANNTMFVHYQYFIVTPRGNTPDRPVYRIHNSQYWLNDYQLIMQGRKGQSVNVTLLSITDITDPANEVRLGSVYVNTDVYLAEQKVVFEQLKHQS